MPGDSLASASPLNLPSSSTKAASSATSSRDVSMLFIGTACRLATCRREDFLPLQCGNCGEEYCGNHFNPSEHDCTYSLHPERKGNGEHGDYLVPLCPLCSEVPQGWKRAEDPGAVIERHVNSGACSVLDARLAESRAARKARENRCHYRRCEKIMIVRMPCEKCHEAFCPSHRAPAQHSCASDPATTSKQRQASQRSNAASFSGLAAMKRLALSGPPRSEHRGGSEPSASSKQSDTHGKDPLGINSISSSFKSRAVDKWVPRPIFGQA